MPAGSTVADEFGRVADALRAVDETLLRAHRLLADVDADGIAPGASGAALTDVLTDLDARLSGTAEESGDGARALRRRAGGTT